MAPRSCGSCVLIIQTSVSRGVANVCPASYVNESLRNPTLAKEEVYLRYGEGIFGLCWVG